MEVGILVVSFQLFLLRSLLIFKESYMGFEVTVSFFPFLVDEEAMVKMRLSEEINLGIEDLIKFSMIFSQPDPFMQ